MIVPIEVTTDARAILARYQVQRKGATHLQVVLCHWGSQYVTWTHNKQTAGYGHGHYHGPVARLARPGDRFALPGLGIAGGHGPAPGQGEL